MAYMDKNPGVYCTSYCNWGHRLKDGVPVGHECHVLPPESLRLEMEGDFQGAVEAVDRAKPMRVSRGL